MSCGTGMPDIEYRTYQYHCRSATIKRKKPTLKGEVKRLKKEQSDLEKVIKYIEENDYQVTIKTDEGRYDVKVNHSKDFFIGCRDSSELKNGKQMLKSLLKTDWLTGKGKLQAKAILKLMELKK